MAKDMFEFFFYWGWLAILCICAFIMVVDRWVKVQQIRQQRWKNSKGAEIERIKFD